MDVGTALRLNRNGQWEFIEGQLINDCDVLLAQNKGEPYPVIVNIDNFTCRSFFEFEGKQFPLRKGGGYFLPKFDINSTEFDELIKNEKKRVEALIADKEIKKTLLENFKWFISNHTLGQPGDYKFLDLRKSHFGNSCFAKANLDHTELNNSILDGANFFQSTPWEANFSKASLLGANFSFISGWDLILEDANLSGADFYESTLAEANFNRSVCAGTNFANANLESGSFVDANLCGANFHKANLSNVDFTGANLSRADLRSAKLEGTIISKQQLLSAITD